jgi:hypothetical protein
MFSSDEAQYNVDLWTFEGEEVFKPSLNWIRDSHLTYWHTEILTYHLTSYQNHMPFYTHLTPTTLFFIMSIGWKVMVFHRTLLIPFWYISTQASKSRTKALSVNHVDERSRYHK